jgi:hypothetical protein
MRLSSCNLFIYSLQILAANLVSKSAAFAEDQDPLPFHDDPPEVHQKERHLRSRPKKERSTKEKIPSFLREIDEERKLSIPGVSGYGLGVQDARNYWLAYGINIPNNADFRSSTGVPYTDDYSREGDMPLPTAGFDRVGYYLELEKNGETPQWVWVSFDAFTADINKIAFPTFASGAIFQEEVTNMNVASSIPALNREGITGNIEFWPHNYGRTNVKGVSGASDSVYDLGDERSGGGSYGSMQVHSSELGGTIFAINRWNDANTPVDIGIGNNPDGNPDWTFTVNGNSYTTKRLEVLVKPAPIVCLYQSDFDDGTLILSKPGQYKLCEDITFYPLVNPPETSSEGAANAFEPIFSGHYDENAFGLGFFAALSIATNDLTLDLNGHIIQQSEEHALLQRFFAVIELADSPFIKGVGPAQFVAESNEFNSASNISIIGPGTIGRSAHHGIHGNENDNVLIKDVTFVDFEVAAVSLNKVDRLSIENCEIERNRHNVPILGMFSAARFIRPYGKILKDAGFSMNLRGVPTSAAEVYDRLVTSINNVYDDVIQVGTINKGQHPTEYDLFHNEPRVVDGPCYAFLVNGRGPAVGDFRFELNATLASNRVTISNNTIQNIKCWTNEVPAIVEANKVMNDVRGAIFQLTNSSSGSGIAINNDGTYKGNIVADMQIMVAKAINDGDIENTPQLQTAVNSIDSTIIDWASSSDIVYEPRYRCNGDSMHHVVKGMTVIRVDNTVGFRIEDNVVEQVTNLSPPSFDECDDYLKGPNNENADDSLQQGANIRGISVAAVTGYANEESLIKGNRMRNFISDNADIMIGIDIQGKSDSILTEDNYIDLKPSVREDETGPFIALRVRKYSDSLDANVKIAKNYFAQETQTVNVTITEPRSCPHTRNIINPGGCPFASRGNRK